MLFEPLPELLGLVPKHFAQNTLSLMNLKSKLPPKFQKYASPGVIPKVFLLPFALASVLLIFLVRPFVVIRIFRVNPWRLGHLTTEVEIARLNAVHLSRRRKHITIFYFPERKPANQFLCDFWQRSLPSTKGMWGWLFYETAYKFGRNSLIVEASLIDFQNLFQIYPNNLRFTCPEIEAGENFLEAIGCKKRNYVCLMVRDSSYLDKIRPDKKFDYYNYRDSSIASYLTATEALTARGFTVLRMGQIVTEELRSPDPMIIDYATNGMRTEFLDLFLGANCKMCITTDTGFDSISRIFRRPIFYVNLLPLFPKWTVVQPTVQYPKTLRDKNRPLSLREVIEIDLISADHDSFYRNAGVTVRDMSSEELVEAVTEMAARVEGTFVETPEQKEMQAKLKHILSTHPKLQPSPNYYPIRAQFASCFLSRYPNFLD